jgi:hypothetical protein
MLRYEQILNEHTRTSGGLGISTRHGLDGSGIESRWRRYFPHPSTPALGLTQPTIQRV